MKGLIREIEISLRDRLETKSIGPMKSWIQGFAETDLEDLKNRIKLKFVIADSAMIAAMETSLTNGMMSKGETQFTKGCNMLKKFQELEELQSTLKGFCPEAMLDGYDYAKQPILQRFTTNYCILNTLTI